MTRFQPEKARCFSFTAYSFRPRTGELRLDYRLDEHEFRERIVFCGAKPPNRPATRAALDRCFHLTHLMAGISYFKAAIPAQIRIETRKPGPLTGRLLEQTYGNGLGEFAYRNGLSLGDRCRFATGPVERPERIPLRGGSVVPLGGGKDSLVSCEMLRAAGMDFRTIAVGQAPLIAEVAAAVGVPHLRIERHLDPNLLALNEQGAYNGHVPISAILACIMLCAGLLYGYDTLVMSNERSAEEGNLILADGSAVNHQYSKTLAFERAFAETVDDEVLPGFRYFSLLRSLSELAVSQRFAGLRRYHQIFSSCNANFRQHGVAAARWCRNCPKCRFVYLALAPFLPRDEMDAIFGHNLLDDPAQSDGYRALLGLGAAKPFECVGEIDESRAALRALAANHDWADARLVLQLGAELSQAGPAGRPLEAWLKPQGERRVPGDFLEALPCFG